MASPRRFFALRGGLLDSGHKTAIYGSWKGIRVIQERISRARKIKDEREVSVITIYDQLDLDQRAVFNSKLHEHKVHAINHYSQVLNIDLTTAKSLWHKMCSEYL